MNRDILEGSAARAAVKRGIDKAVNPIKVTLGIKGRNVILDTNPYTIPVNTNDGVTIARELVLEDRFENVGAKIVRSAANKTNDTAGDGTTTASVLVQAIVDEGMRQIEAGRDPVFMRKGIEKAAAAVVSEVKKEAKKATDIDTLTAIATISCGDPTIGAMVAELVDRSGEDGIVTLEDNPEPETVYEELEGLRLRGGFTVPVFVNVPEMQQASFKNAPIVVTNANLTLADEIARIAEAAQTQGKKEVVVIANGIDSDALLTAMHNWAQRRFFILPIRVLAYGESGEGVMRDVAAITGATFIDSTASMRILDLKPEDLGWVDKVVADKRETTIVADREDDDGNSLKELRAKELKTQLKVTDRQFERDSLNERIAKLNSAMFTIKVGGTTETEQKERKLRIEDAVNATKAAVTDGVVSGGGTALYRAARHTEELELGPLTDEGVGYMAVLKACEAPIRQMAANASVQIDKSEFKELLKPNKTFDFTTGVIVNAFESGIIDPAKVVTQALENAASESALFLTTEAVVVLKEAPREEQV